MANEQIEQQLLPEIVVVRGPVGNARDRIILLQPAEPPAPLTNTPKVALLSSVDPSATIRGETHVLTTDKPLILGLAARAYSGCDATLFILRLMDNRLLRYLGGHNSFFMGWGDESLILNVQGLALNQPLAAGNPRVQHTGKPVD